MPKPVLLCIALIIQLFLAVSVSADYADGPLNWSRIGETDIDNDLALVAYVEGRLILVAGGAEGHFRAIDAGSGKLEHEDDIGWSVQDAAAVTFDDALVVVGGRDADGWSDRVGVLSFGSSPGVPHHVQVSNRPALPEALSDPVAAHMGDKVYVIGSTPGDEAGFGFFMRVAGPGEHGWSAGAELPGGIELVRALVPQAGGERKHLYLFADNVQTGSGYLYEYDSVSNNWWEREPVPVPMRVEQVTAMGSHHLLVIGSVDGSRQSYIYHTVMDNWAPIESSQLASVTRVVRPSREPLLLCSDGSGTTGLYRIEGARVQPRFFWLDYIALGSYLLLLVAVGWYFSRGERTTDDFFLAGRRIPWWAASLSLMATQVSSIGFIAVPAKTFATDWIYFIGVLSWFVIVPIVTRVYIPFFRKLNVTSAYEYLEARFNVWVRLFAALVFSLLQIGRMAVVLYLPALVLSVVTGFPIYACVLIMGVLATAYTTAGGMEAVIWTDVLQAMLLLCGALLCVIVAVAHADGGVTGMFATAIEDDKFRFMNPSWDITTSAVWVILLGSVFSRFAGVSADQSVIQRYLTTTDEKQAARALWGDVAVSIPWALIVFLMGTALYVFYKSHPGQVTPGIGADAMVPLFVSQELPMGISGLIIAAIFAAAMSSLDSSIHSVATVAVTDVYKRFVPTSDEKSRLRLARTLTILLGAFGTAIALLMASTFVVSVWDVFLEIMGLLAGVLAGLFLLGLFTVRANGTGTLAGALIGAVSLYVVKQHTEIHFFLYSVIGIGVCFVCGYILSRVLPGTANIRELTVLTQDKKGPHTQIEQPVPGNG